VKATVTLAVTGANGPNEHTLATLTVPGLSSVTVPLGSLTGDPQLRNSITVESNAAKGALYASMVVFGGTKIPSVQLLGRDFGQPYNGGAHPWTTAGGAASTLVMFNYGSTAQPFYVAISGGNVLWQQKYQLAPLETKTLDIGGLVAAQAKDANRNTLPAGATQGVAHWFTPNYGQGSGRLLVSQPGAGLARNFACQQSTALCGGSGLQNASATIAAGGTGTIGPFTAALCSTSYANPQCGGTDYLCTVTWPAQWTSSNSSVASVLDPNNSGDAVISGNQPGTASITGAGTGMNIYNSQGYLVAVCYPGTQTGTATVTPSCATVTNFTENFVNSGSDGTLYWNYTWSSSTGKQSDLAACTIGETVFYPGTSNP